MIGIAQNACPVVSQQPAPVSTCPSGTATFSITASGTTPAYQWQWQPAGPGTAWAALSNGINNDSQGAPAFDVSGATTREVGFRSIWGLGGNFRCIVANTCGSVTSDEAMLTICAADFDCSGTRDVADIFAFLSAWFAADPRSDFNASGVRDVADIFAFLSAWFAGC